MNQHFPTGTYTGPDGEGAKELEKPRKLSEAPNSRSHERRQAGPVPTFRRNCHNDLKFGSRQTTAALYCPPGTLLRCGGFC
ncbi:hypothetical protein WOLCODRAFT_155155 [Wolfiporia cocos MD-104 SS10]|uniref:Uncharacterized protein n=1 Tax=Wolfiporia cocos (strain MD-104) TaxID=742152 RepID=A0A2H3K4Q5_WOLCO|nr:hypothetical protein WOLCODRAFT_155155 [Wolfiporia cocos MD-104 SS10]